MNRQRIILLGILVIAAIAIGVFLNGRNTKENGVLVVKRGDVVQQVSVSGKVKPVRSVDLAFEKTGKVSSVYVDIGSFVGAGDTLVILENQDLVAQLAKAEADLEELNLENVERKGAVDLESLYDGALSAAQKSSVIAKAGLITLTDIQYAQFALNDQDGIVIAEAKAAAVEKLLGGQNAGRWNSETISALNGGSFAKVQAALADPTPGNIEAALADTLVALRSVKIALDVVPAKSTLTTTEKTNLSTARTDVASEVVTIAGKIQSISVQKVSSENTVSATRAQIKSAEAEVQNLEAQIAKTYLRSPIAGVVTKRDVNMGEIVAANSPIISLISQGQFEIEASVPEVNITLVKIGDAAAITLDAYGSDVPFAAHVASVDPAETIVDGVSTYTVRLHFDTPDPRIKSGMTANVQITTEKKLDSIAVPQGAVFAEDGKKFVQLKKGEIVEKVQVETGIVSSLGYIEITSGLNEGDRVLLNPDTSVE